MCPGKNTSKMKKKKLYFDTRKLLKLKKENNLPKENEGMAFFEIPNMLPGHLSKYDRLKLIKEASEKSKLEFENRYQNIQNWFREYDPLYLLSFCAVYFVSCPEGQDPELTGNIEFHPYFLEIMQAFALSQERNYSLKPLSQDADKIRNEIKEIGNLLLFSHFHTLSEQMTEEEIRAIEVIMDMRLQTTAIRNWAYIHQMKRIVSDLSRLVRNKYEKLFSIDLNRFMDVIYKITEERNVLLNKHLEKVRYFWKKEDYREMIQAYNEVFPENTPVKEDQIDEIWINVDKNIEYLKGLLAFHSDLKLEKIFTFSLDHFVSLYGDQSKREIIKSRLDELSFQFGDLKEHRKEYFILDNPIHQKPFIKIDKENYYSAIFFIMPHLLLGLFEKMISENDELLMDYNNKIKSKYLEDEVERLFRKYFPNAEIYRGCQWQSTSDSRLYENDLFVRIDTFAIIIEAKAGGITPPAKRGAPKRLFDTLKELIEEPSEQSLKFIEFLKNNKRKHFFTNKRGENVIIDSLRINYYIPLGVTLTTFGVISANLKKLVKAGITKKKIDELAPSMSLTDLECIFELLTFEAEVIHYLARRREFDYNVDYEGDELDLLSFYLDNGFNIGEEEYKQKHNFLLTTGSKNLDPYFIAKAEGKYVEKPRHKMSDWWIDILYRLSTRKPQNWIETSYILLSTIKNDQIKFEQGIKELIKRIRDRNVEKKHNWAQFFSGPQKRCFLITGYPYETSDKEERNGVIATILDPNKSENLRGAVVIGININRRDYPYSVLAGKLDTNLFEA